MNFSKNTVYFIVRLVDMFLTMIYHSHYMFKQRVSVNSCISVKNIGSLHKWTELEDEYVH